MIAWNLESGDSEAEVLGRQMAQKGPIDLWALSELEGQKTLAILESAVEAAGHAPYDALISRAGRSDRLGLVYREDRFQLLGVIEETSVQVGNPGLRPAFGARLLDRDTSQRLTVLVSHLKCCGGENNISIRVQQARALNEFARTESDPVFLLGDLNSPTNPFEERVPAALGVLVDGPFRWIRPAEIVPTQSSKRYKSMLDYVLVANGESWSGSSSVLMREGTNAATLRDPMVDTPEGSDHRPVLGVFRYLGE